MKMLNPLCLPQRGAMVNPVIRDSEKVPGSFSFLVKMNLEPFFMKMNLEPFFSA
jgi:hypothetical protein